MCRWIPRRRLCGNSRFVLTLLEALAAVIVVLIFLQGWRATLILLLAVPVSVIGTFIIFPALGFLSTRCRCLDWCWPSGLVVDDAIIVVEAVEHHIEEGMAPKEATIKAMEEVGGPVVAIALILASGIHFLGVYSGYYWLKCTSNSR